MTEETVALAPETVREEAAFSAKVFRTTLDWCSLGSIVVSVVTGQQPVAVGIRLEGILSGLDRKPHCGIR